MPLMTLSVSLQKSQLHMLFRGQQTHRNIEIQARPPDENNFYFIYSIQVQYNGITTNINHCSDITFKGMNFASAFVMN